MPNRGEHAAEINPSLEIRKDAMLQRLERIENKVDKLAEALTTMARVEERVSAHMDGMKRFGDRLDAIEIKQQAAMAEIYTRLNTLDRESAAAGVINKGQTKLAWLFLSAFISLVSAVATGMIVYYLTTAHG